MKKKWVLARRCLLARRCNGRSPRSHGCVFKNTVQCKIAYRCVTTWKQFNRGKTHWCCLLCMLFVCVFIFFNSCINLRTMCAYAVTMQWDVDTRYSDEALLSDKSQIKSPLYFLPLVSLVGFSDSTTFWKACSSSVVHCSAVSRALFTESSARRERTSSLRLKFSAA